MTVGPLPSGVKAPKPTPDFTPSAEPEKELSAEEVARMRAAFDKISSLIGR
jgi:hypothetical protein